MWQAAYNAVIGKHKNQKSIRSQWARWACCIDLALYLLTWSLIYYYTIYNTLLLDYDSCSVIEKAQRARCSRNLLIGTEY
jgi:hypothetical protein